MRYTGGTKECQRCGKLPKEHGSKSSTVQTGYGPFTYDYYACADGECARFFVPHKGPLLLKRPVGAA